MEQQESHNRSERDRRRDSDAVQIEPTHPINGTSGDSFVKSLVDAAAWAEADEKRRRTIAEKQSAVTGASHGQAFTNTFPVLGPSTNNRTQASKERVYQACLPCKKRKTKCVRGDQTNPDELPCARCRRQGKAAECVLAPRGWPSSETGGPNEAGIFATFPARASYSRTEASPAMSLAEHISQAQAADASGSRNHDHHSRPAPPTFTSSTSGSAALDQLMSNVQDIRQAAPSYSSDEGSDGDQPRPKYDPIDPASIWKLSDAERNAIPLEEARKMPLPISLYTWDLDQGWTSDEAMVDREMAKRPYESAAEAKDFRNNRGLRPSEWNALNLACQDKDYREGRHWAWRPPYTNPASSLPRQSGKRTHSSKPPTASSTSVESPTRSERPSFGHSQVFANGRTDHSSMRPPERPGDEDEEEVRIRLRILAVEKEELELQLKLHRLQGAKRRRVN
ncbi:hypothetical protein MBLNU230_g5606t1 [Neophaeotheca triangularis]